MTGCRRLLAGVLTTLALFIFAIQQVQAHPHIWIDARSVVVFNADGDVSAIRHEWTFDQAFSSWSIQGLDTDGDGQISKAEFQSLADENMVGLREYEYYTFAGVGQENVRFSPGPDPHLTYDGARTTLHFTLIPDAPIRVGGLLEIEVSDPEYYASFTFLTDRGVTLENAPDSCVGEVNPPKQIDPAIEQQLFELGPDVTVLPPELKSVAADLANVVIVRCDGIAPRSALEASERLSRGTAAPFGAPPVERGLPVVRTGLLGWIFKQQQTFYGAMTNALGQLRADGNAFWVLSLISFLYGVFHAAGPGHGKVVISSYVLATESELKRGIGLSFASALMQAVTAVVFVLFAALVLNMTSMRLSESANVLVIGSYVLVILLGLWLIARKLFGFGHSHHHHAHNHDHHDHAHHDDHVHMVTPKQMRGGWREVLGVVLAVGLRPCSGALVVLVFALSQGVLAAGIAAVFIMALGTALTVSALAIVAVGAKGAARLFDKGPYAAVAADVLWWLELFGAVLVLAFGVILLMANL